MTPDEFTARLTAFLNTKPDVLIQIPSGSGIFSIAAIQPVDWVSGFVSTRENRWNKSGQPNKYFGSDFYICAAELYGTDTGKLDDVVCERWETTDSVLAFDISKFPSDLQSAFYEDKGQAPAKWRKPHVFLDASAASTDYYGVRTIYAPSASGMALGLSGGVFAADPKQQPLKLIETGVFSSMIHPE